MVTITILDPKSGQVVVIRTEPDPPPQPTKPAK